MPRPTSLLKGFEKAVETVRPNPKKRITVFDEATTGLCLLVTPRGRRTFTLVARGPNQADGKRGKQIWREIGVYPPMTVDEARQKARVGLERVKAGQDPFPPPEPEPEPDKPETFNDVADNFLKRHVRKEGQGEPALRSADSIERQLTDFFRPIWGEKPFADIRRSDVAKALQSIADERGPVMADRALATLSKLFKLQTPFMPDEWQPPLMVGMRKTRASARARTRIVVGDDFDDGGDADLRLIWQAAGRAGTFGAFVRILILTGQRRTKVATMKWSDLSDGTWTLATEPGEKGNAEDIKLSALALDTIRGLHEIAGNPYVFAARAGGHLLGYGPLKKKLDAAIREANDGEDIKPWTLHDLRRTSKSLMQRAGVDREVSERILGHTIQGSEGVYARHKFRQRKAEALEALAAMVQSIVDPRDDNVVSMPTKGAA